MSCGCQIERFRALGVVALGHAGRCSPPAFHKDSSAPAGIHRAIYNREAGMLVSPNGSPVIGVGIRADRGDAFREQLLAMRTYKGATVAAAE
jgi:hypothetical protein